MHDSFPKFEVDIILNLPVGGIRREDRFAWHFNNNGSQSVKSGYWVGYKMDSGCKFGCSSDPNSVRLWQLIWRLKRLNKVKLFMWGAHNNGLLCAVGD